jgi:Mrp family chromosome partitioning ATPase/capsular polysaccharide biosynthesis protein
VPVPEEHWADGPSLLGSMWRHRVVVVAATVLAAILGYAYSQAQTPLYEARTRLLLTDPRSNALLGETYNVDLDRYVPQQAERVTSTPVIQRAVSLLGGTRDAEDLRRGTAISSDLELLAIRIAFTDPDPAAAAAIADALAQAYQLQTREATIATAEAAVQDLAGARDAVQEEILRLEAQAGQDDLLTTVRLQALTQQLAALETRARELTVDATVSGSGVQFVEPAGVPGSPISPTPLRDAALAGFLGAALAGAWSYWRAGRGKYSEGPADPAAVLGAPLLGEIPDFVAPQGSGGLGWAPPHVSEAYQFALASVEYLLPPEGGAILLTSAEQGDGKTLTALELAMHAAAHEDHRIVVVDADLRARGLTTLLGAENQRGLGDTSSDTARVERCTHRWAVDEDLAVSLMPAGSPVPDPTAFFRTPSFRATIDHLRETFRLVLIDTPPALSVVDSSLAAAHVDGVVLVVRHGEQLDSLREIRRRLGFVATPLLGYVYNRSRSAAATAYGYGYDYGGRTRRETPTEWVRRVLTERSSPVPPARGPGGQANGKSPQASTRTTKRAAPASTGRRPG